MRTATKIDGTAEYHRLQSSVSSFRRIARIRITNNVMLLAIAYSLAIVFLPGELYQSFASAEPHPPTTTVTDFVDFWAASRLLLYGGNPFSPAEVLKLQQSVGFSDSQPLLMWNPPWTLSFILPFGALDFLVSQFLWLLLQVLSIAVSAQILWKIYSQTEQKSYLPWIASLTLTPCWLVLIIGQITPLVLLAIVGFLYFERKKQYVLAGLATSLISIKPHLVYLFWIALLFWILHKRCWSVALGAVIAGSVVIVIPIIFDPMVYSQFMEMYRFPGRSTPFELPAASLGSLLTIYVASGKGLIQFLPPLLGVFWFLWHWRRYKENWDWRQQIPIIILVSVTLNAYAWTYDYVILLPAVIYGLTILNRQSSSYRALVLVYCGINACYFVAKLFVTSDIYYFWLAPAFLLIYLWLSALSNRAAPAMRHAMA